MPEPNEFFRRRDSSSDILNKILNPVAQRVRGSPSWCLNKCVFPLELDKKLGYRLVCREPAAWGGWCLVHHSLPIAIMF